MAIEMNNRTKILAGVVVLLAAGAGAWFFFLDDFLNEPPPKPAAVAPAKAAPASKAADAPASADAGKAAAPAAKPAAKPVPGSPDQLIAEVIDTSGVKVHFQPYAREIMLRAILGDTKRESVAPADVAAVNEMVDRAFEPGKLGAALAANLKANFDAERMARFLELLRQPVVTKMNQELRNATSDAVVEFAAKSRATPPTAERLKSIQSLDDVMVYSETGVDFATAIVRPVVDGFLNDLQKSGKNVSREARQEVGATLNAMRNQMRGQSRTLLQVAYRNASDQELAEYVKLLDTDTGRWGMEQLSNAARPVLVEMGNTLGKESTQLASSKRTGTVAKKAPEPAPEPLAKASTTPAAAPAPAVEKPVEAAAPVAPPQPVGYQRASNVRDLYSRYNDLITATVMRDRAAVKELLDDGKSPNVRQADGSTPLMIAVGNNDAATAGMLLAKGADPNLRASGGATALSIARSRGASGAELVQLLQRSGAKD
jgi:hypothetical protein